MKYVSFFFSVLWSAGLLMAQNSPVGSSAISPLTTDESSLVVHRINDIIFDNSPYLPSGDAGQKGYFVQANGRKFQYNQLRFDTALNRIEYKEGVHWFTPKEYVIEFGFENGDVFENSFKPLDKHTDENTFFQVIYDGKTKLLKRTTSMAFDVTPYNSATKVKHFNHYITFYVVKPNQEVGISKKQNEKLLSVLNDRRNEIADYIKQKSLKIKVTEDLKKIMAYYDSLGSTR